MSNNRYDLTDRDAAQRRERPHLAYISTAKYGADWHSTPHTHVCTELFYVVGGLGQFRVEDRVCPVEAGDLVIINPNVAHTEVSLGAYPLEYIVLGVEGLDLSWEGDSRCQVVSFRGRDEELLFCLRGMLREIESEQEGHGVVCQDLLEILLVRLKRAIHFSAAPAPAQRRSSKECAIVRQYIDNHFKENLNLDKLSEIAHLNKYHMVHSFSREYGVSPISYLLSRRIQESRYLLRTTDISLAQISQLLGFSAPSYFSQSFRRLEGVSPMEYRRQSRERA